jgi:hypothetical protein
MGLSDNLDLKGTSLIQAVKKLEDAQKQYPHLDLSGLRDINHLNTYIEQIDLFAIKTPEVIERCSKLGWNQSTTGGYVLLLPNQEQVSITQNLLNKWAIQAGIKGIKYKGERDTLEEAFQVADNLVYSKAQDLLKLLKRDGLDWHDHKATEGQIKLLTKFSKGHMIPKDLTKGKAYKLISQFLASKEKICR